MEPARWVHVVRSEGVGPDSILTFADPDDPAWPPVTRGMPGRWPVGAGGYLRPIPDRRILPGRSAPGVAGWAFRPAGEAMATEATTEGDDAMEAEGDRRRRRSGRVRANMARAIQDLIGDARGLAGAYAPDFEGEEAEAVRRADGLLAAAIAALDGIAGRRPPGFEGDPPDAGGG